MLKVTFKFQCSYCCNTRQTKLKIKHICNTFTQAVARQILPKSVDVSQSYSKNKRVTFVSETACNDPAVMMTLPLMTLVTITCHTYLHLTSLSQQIQDSTMQTNCRITKTASSRPSSIHRTIQQSVRCNG